MKTKQVIVVRKDLNMRKGKVGAQSAHASLAVFLNKATQKSSVLTIDLDKFGDHAEAVSAWIASSFRKICVYVNSEQELIDVYQKAAQAGLPCSLITDKGDTEFHGVPTKTTCAIGPASEEDVDKITGSLPLY